MITQVFGFFKAASPARPINDEAAVKNQYRYWRLRIFYSMFIGYVFYYFTRYSYIAALPALMADLGYEKVQLGHLGTVFALTYGLSKFVSGILSDRSNPRYIMAAGLIVTGFVNIFFGMSSSIVIFALLWGINGWFQGFGWPPCARLLTHWYSQNERGGWWSTWNASHNVGGLAIRFLAAGCTAYLGWRYAMYVPGVLCVLMGFFLINRLRDTPQSLGLPSIEKFRNDYGALSEKEVEEEERELSTKEILFGHVLLNPYIWLLALAYFLVYVVRIGVVTWGVLFLVESKGYSNISANFCLSLFEIGGFCGSLSAGWISDRIFRARRGPVNVLFALAMLISIGFLWFVPPGFYWMDWAGMILVGFSVFGPQMMIGMAAAELAHKKASATATGFIGWFGYLGAAAAGYPLARIAQDWGWGGFYFALAFCCLASILFLLPLWPAGARRAEPTPA